MAKNVSSILAKDGTGGKWCSSRCRSGEKVQENVRRPNGRKGAGRDAAGGGFPSNGLRIERGRKGCGGSIDRHRAEAGVAGPGKLEKLGRKDDGATAGERFEDDIGRGFRAGGGEEDFRGAVERKEVDGFQRRAEVDAIAGPRGAGGDPIRVRSDDGRAPVGMVR